MGIVLSLFRSRPPKSLTSQYGEILANIEKDVVAYQDKRAVLRERHKSFVRTIFLYGVVIYMIVLMSVYLLHPGGKSFGLRMLRIAPIIIIPLMLYLFKQMVDCCFLRKIQHYDKTLDELERMKAAKLEELFDRTDFIKMQTLLHKYGKNLPGMPAPLSKPSSPMMGGMSDASAAASLLHQGAGAAGVAGAAGAGEEEDDHPIIIGGAGAGQLLDLASTIPRLTEEDKSRLGRTDVKAPPLQRTKVDRFVDYFLGDGPNNRYALICESCHRHNGLVREQDLSIRYHCAFCQHLNGPEPIAAATLSSAASSSSSSSSPLRKRVNSSAAVNSPPPPQQQQQQQQPGGSSAPSLVKTPVSATAGADRRTKRD